MQRRFSATHPAAAGLAALAGAPLTPTASAREGGTFEESVTSDAVVCRTTTTDAGPLRDPVGDPMPGESSLAVAYAPAPESTTRTERLQEGNQRVVSETVTTPFELDEVALRVTGLTNAVEVSAEVIGRELSILVRNLPGDTPEAEGSLHLRGDEGTGTVTLRSADGAAAGRAPVAATLTRLGPSVVDQFSEDGFFLARRTIPYRLDLNIALPGGAQSTSCRMDLVTQRMRVDLPK